MFQTPSLALRIKPRVWERPWGSTLFPCCPQLPPHTLSQKKKKRIRWHCSCRISLITSTFCSWTCGTGTFPICSAVLSPRQVCGCRLSPVRALQTTSPAKISTISSTNHSTGTSTICSRICSMMTLGMTVRNGHQHHVNQMTTCESHDNLKFPSPKDVTAASGPTK